jgi:putative membrane protein
VVPPVWLYDWLKVLHITAVISWMVGLFYLPRLFVYHADAATAGSEPAETFVIMERRLIKVIMNPAMMVSWAARALACLERVCVDGLWLWIKIVRLCSV